MTVLIIEDDDATRQRLQRVLPGETRTAATLGEGLHVAADWQPSVIVLDNRFADDARRTGIDALPEIHAACPRAEIVVLTGFYQPHEEWRAMRLGAFSYLEKGDDRALRRVILAARRCVPSVFVPSSGEPQ